MQMITVIGTVQLLQQPGFTSGSGGERLIAIGKVSQPISRGKPIVEIVLKYIVQFPFTNIIVSKKCLPLFVLREKMKVGSFEIRFRAVSAIEVTLSSLM